MLVPLTREKFEQLIPLLATGSQYKYYWGKFSDFLQRLLISVVIAAVVLLAKVIFRLSVGPIVFFLGLIGALYWLWGPVLWASLRNWKYRRYKYCGFFRGKVLDSWITEELLGKQETVNNKGDLVIVENREKRINLEVGDETGFTALLKAPLKVSHKVVNPGQLAEMLVLSNSSDLSRIEAITDIYIPKRQLWVSDYPSLRHDFFNELGRRIGNNRDERPRNSRCSPSRERYRGDEESYDDEEREPSSPRRRNREIEGYYDDDEWESSSRRGGRDIEGYYDDERESSSRRGRRGTEEYYNDDEWEPSSRRGKRDIEGYYDDDEWE